MSVNIYTKKFLKCLDFCFKNNYNVYIKLRNSREKVMRDYAKQDFSIPKRTDRAKGNPIVGFIACVAMGAIIGALLGYGLLYT